MLLPSGSKKENNAVSVSVETPKKPLEITSVQLEELLAQIKGAGKVEVLLTYAASERTVFYADERSSSSENSLTKEYETVLISGNNRQEEALISHTLAPNYLGAVIVCQGADDPSVKLAVSEAVSKATGLGTDRISVLRMK